MFTGLKLQDVIDPIGDSTYSMSAVQIAFQPEDAQASLRGNITASPAWSRISWAGWPDFPAFLVVTTEALDLLDRCGRARMSTRNEWNGRSC